MKAQMISKSNRKEEIQDAFHLGEVYAGWRFEEQAIL